MVEVGFIVEVAVVLGDEVALIVEEVVKSFELVVAILMEEVLGLINDDENGRLPCHSTQYSFPITSAKQSTPGL